MVKHGVRITERYLPLDTAVTVVGELVRDSVGNIGGTEVEGSRARLADHTSPGSSQLLPPPYTSAGGGGGGGGDIGEMSDVATATTAGVELMKQAALEALPYTLRMPGHGPFHVTSMTLPQLRSSLERTSGVIRVSAG